VLRSPKTKSTASVSGVSSAFTRAPTYAEKLMNLMGQKVLQKNENKNSKSMRLSEGHCHAKELCMRGTIGAACGRGMALVLHSEVNLETCPCCKETARRLDGW
jgi:hypothetical protein